MKRKTSEALFIALVLILGAFAANHLQGEPTVAQTATVGNLKGAKAGPQRLYPDPLLTPGDVLTTDASVVCVKGYSGTVRNVSASEKNQVYAEYDETKPADPASYEVDHFISLELGGSNDIKNLWPEPAEPRPGFHEKDKVENYLHAQVCSGTMPLIEAQKEIAEDWYAVYLKIP